MSEAKPVEFIKKLYQHGKGKAVHFTRDIAIICGVSKLEYVKIRPIDGGCMILPCSKEEGDAVFDEEGDGK